MPIEIKGLEAVCDRCSTSIKTKIRTIDEFKDYLRKKGWIVFWSSGDVICPKCRTEIEASGDTFR